MAAKSTLYTKTGDGGETSLYNGERRHKSDSLIMALGSVDELNSAIGLAACYCNGEVKEVLEFIQSRLLDLGSVIATPETSSAEKLNRVAFPEAHIEMLEMVIDDYDAQLPPLKNFILPGGSVACAHLHLARAICRRAESHVSATDVNRVALRYLNRLSDYLFAAARYVAKISGADEVVYCKK